MTTRLIIALSLAAATLVGCTGSDDNTETTSPTTDESTAAPTDVSSDPTVIPASVFTLTRPDEPLELLDAKASSAVGDTVTFLCRVGGTRDPFVNEMSVFVVADGSLVSCELKPEDHCSKPWDYCCVPMEDRIAGLATIRLVDDAGKPFPATARGVGGLEESKWLVVEGTVHDRNEDGVFIVNASRIWVGGKPSRDNVMGGSV